MTTPRRFLPFLAAVITALAAGVLLTAALTPPAQAQDEPEQPVPIAATETRSITVQGQSSIAATPDRATVRLGVVTQAPTATAALADNAALMQDVISATLDLDIPEDQVRTQTVQLYPVYSSSPPVDIDAPATQAQEPQITGYRATNVVAVTVDDVALVADLLDAATAAGANNVEGISFEVTGRADLLAEARRDAMRDARLRAETYLEETGDALGTVLTIRELGTSQPFPVAREEVFAVGGAGVPIQPGQQTVDVSVEVTWSLTTGE